MKGHEKLHRKKFSCEPFCLRSFWSCRKMWDFYCFAFAVHSIKCYECQGEDNLCQVGLLGERVTCSPGVKHCYKSWTGKKNYFQPLNWVGWKRNKQKNLHFYMYKEACLDQRLPGNCTNIQFYSHWIGFIRSWQLPNIYWFIHSHSQ